MRTILAVALSSFLFGCGATTIALRDQPAQIDGKTGNVIAFWLEYSGREAEPILVTEPYGALMIWYGGDKRFYVYDNIAKTYFMTKEFPKFLQKLDALPHSIAIQRFDTCTVSRAHDLSRAHWRRIEQVLKSGNRRWALGVTGRGYDCLCTCESRGFRYPDSRVPAD